MAILVAAIIVLGGTVWVARWEKKMPPTALKLTTQRSKVECLPIRQNNRSFTERPKVKKALKYKANQAAGTSQVNILLQDFVLPPLCHVVQHGIEMKIYPPVHVGSNHFPRLGDQPTSVFDLPQWLVNLKEHNLTFIRQAWQKTNNSMKNSVICW